jgi:hypothetical protein
VIAYLLLLYGLAFEAWRHDFICSCDDVVLVGADEVVLGEEELVQKPVLIDGCFAVCH